MRIDVTQEDIEKGKTSNCKRCPVARAMNRATGKKFSVCGTWCYVLGPSCRDYDLPSEVTAFVHDFDANEPVSPFSFDLDLEGVAK